MRPGPRRRGLFAAVATLIFLLAGELVLRLAGFQYQPTVSYMEFNFPRPHELHQIFEPDPELLWRMRPGFEFGEGFPALNGEGFRGPEFGADKAAGTVRIACLGDSVTFGRPEAAYPELLAGILAERRGGPVEAMNFGVPGYSSWQGRRLLDRVLREYRPDAVIILFGWNDHWLAQGFADKDQNTAAPAPTRAANPLRWLRVYQLLHRAVALGHEVISPAPLVLRVGEDDYRSNLAAMIAACRLQGVKVVVVTAPSAIGAGRTPDYLTILKFIKDDSDLPRLHRQYNDVARSAARDAGAPLADVDAVFQGKDARELFADPERDLIHPNAPGLRIMAETIADVAGPELAPAGAGP